MAILWVMASQTIRSTYSLDVETVRFENNLHLKDSSLAPDNAALTTQAHGR